MSKQTMLMNIVSDYELMLHYYRLLSSHFSYFRVICLFPIFFVWADNITLPINLLRLTYSRNERVICIYLMVETKYIKTKITLLLHLSKQRSKGNNHQITYMLMCFIVLHGVLLSSRNHPLRQFASMIYEQWYYWACNENFESCSNY